jgi:orotidine-5'-phosphate decarboxylase
MLDSNKIICALDFDNLTNAADFVSKINYDIVFKVGMEFFFNFGLEGVNKIRKKKPGVKLFLDLKLHDIPNTVASSLFPLIENIRPYMITLHVSGGSVMLKEAVKAVNHICEKRNFKKPIILGVTILTSLAQEDMTMLGHSNPIQDYVVKYSELAHKSGLNGVVCSALETKLVKSLYKDLIIVTPGIRINKNNYDDQSRVVTPKEAFSIGSDFIVMGRPLIQSKDPNIVISDIIYNKE